MKRLRTWKHRHWGEHALIALIGFGAVIDWFPVSDQFSNVSGWVIGGVMIGAFLVHFGHLRGALCEDCIAAMPLDGHEAARSRKVFLRAFHKLHDGPYAMLLLLVGMVAMMFVGGIFEKRSIPYLLVYSAVNLVLVGFYLTLGIHRRLQPWCPQCHWGRDDDDEETEAPTPDPVTTA